MEQQEQPTTHAAVTRWGERLSLRLRHLLLPEERVLRAEGVAVEEAARSLDGVLFQMSVIVLQIPTNQ